MGEEEALGTEERAERVGGCPRPAWCGESGAGRLCISEGLRNILAARPRCVYRAHLILTLTTERPVAPQVVVPEQSPRTHSRAPRGSQGPQAPVSLLQEGGAGPQAHVGAPSALWDPGSRGGNRKSPRVLLSPPGGSLWRSTWRRGRPGSRGAAAHTPGGCRATWRSGGSCDPAGTLAAGLPETWLLWTKKGMDGRDGVTQTTELSWWKAALLKSPRLETLAHGVWPRSCPQWPRVCCLVGGTRQTVKCLVGLAGSQWGPGQPHRHTHLAQGGRDRPRGSQWRGMPHGDPLPPWAPRPHRRPTGLVPAQEVTRWLCVSY